MKEKFKIKPIYIIIAILLIILLIIFSIFRFNKVEESIKVEPEYASKVSTESMVELLEAFNTGNYWTVKDIYLPYAVVETEEQETRAYEKFVRDFERARPFIFESVCDVEQIDKNTIRGKVYFKDNSKFVNYIEEYEAGWKNFGVQNQAEFEIVKENGEMKISKFIVKQSYTYADVTTEFLNDLDRCTKTNFYLNEK